MFFRYLNPKTLFPACRFVSWKGVPSFGCFPLGFANASPFTKHRFCFALGGSCLVGIEAKPCLAAFFSILLVFIRLLHYAV